MKHPFRYFVFVLYFLTGCSSTLDNTSLHHAIENGDKAKVVALLAQGVSVNHRNEDGMTPLHDTAFAGEQEIAELLLSRGAEVDAKSVNETTPLYWAAIMGHQNLAELLLASACPGRC